MKSDKSNILSEKNNLFIFILPTWLPTYETKNIGKILRYLELSNYKATIFCGPTDHEEHFRSEFPKFKLNTRRKVYRWTNLIGHLKQILNIVLMVKNENENEELVTVWTYAGYRENIWLVLLKRVFGFRVIIKNDSRILIGEKSIINRLSRWLFHIFPANSADGIISETPEVFDNWNKNCVYQKRHIIYSNGADITNLSYSRRIFELKNNKEKYILMTGRLNHEKGIDLAIEAFCRVSHLYPEWRILLVGEVYNDQSYIKACNTIKDYGVGDKVSWIPFCKGNELYEIYHKAAIFVNTSRNEGLPNRFIEAMYFKCAVLTFDIGQCKYLVSSDRGVTVDNGNLESFINKLKILIEDEQLREKLGLSASSFIQSEFNDEVNLPKLIEWMLGKSVEGVIK